MNRFFLILLIMPTFAQDYHEPYRPQIHFSPKEHWTNDPNGLVYFEGEYHLFFQYNPFGDTWGHMSWGHAVSRDLLHWQELPVALPEENGVMIFTGSVVIDTSNSSGFCRDNKPCMVAIYTGYQTKPTTLQTQNLAYSNDRGRTWTKYARNPVLNLNMADFRDPDVFWSPRSKRWIMAVSLPNDHKISIYGSPDLKRWERVSEFGPAGAVSGQWECPDLFELPLDGDHANTRWVLKVGLNPGGLQGGSGEQYFIGHFDGTSFTNDNPPATTLWSDYGKDCYCALTFSNLPASLKPVMIGWMNNWQYAAKVPTMPWRGQMTIPRELSLQTFPEGIRLVQKPLTALQSLRSAHVLGIPGTVTETVDPGGATRSGWKLVSGDGYTEIGYDSLRKEIYVDRSHSGDVSFSKEFPTRTAAPFIAAGPITFDIVLDRDSLEVFAAGGRIAITNLIFPHGPVRLEPFSDGPAKFLTTDSWSLRSIW